MKHLIRPLTLACMVALGSLHALTHAATLTPAGRGWANAIPFDLAPYGGYESEVFMDGKANIYAADGAWRSDGKVKIKVKKADQRYKTRLLVRAPVDAAKFNGTVVVEWFNVSTGFDVEVDAIQGREELLRQGYAWVGVSAQGAGLDGLNRTNKARYSSLSIPSDGLSYDIFTDAARAVREQADVLLNGLKAQRVIAVGQSQSAIRLTTYANAIQPVAQAFDGFFIHSRAAAGAGLDSVLGGPTPAYIRADLNVPVFQLMAETDLPFWKAARQADTPKLRTWEVAGAAHIDKYLLDLVSEVATRDLGYKPTKCNKPINDLPMHNVVKRVFRHLDRWITDGTLPPTAPPISVSFLGATNKDAYGNAKGGVRLPEIEAPRYNYDPTNSGNFADGPPMINPIVCLLAGSQTPLTAKQLQTLYGGNMGNYVTRYAQAADAAAAAGHIFQEDADAGKLALPTATISQP